MRTLTAILMILFTLQLGVAASPQKDAIAAFYEYRTHMLGQQGTAADVDGLLTLFADQAKYEHPQFGVVMNKEEARRGMLAHLREGTDVAFHVHRIRESKDFAVAEVTFRYVVDHKEIVRTGVAIFEFQGDKLSRVAEYGK